MVIYKTVNQINDKWCVGKDTGNWSYYLIPKKAFINALKKYGKQNSKKIIFKECADLAWFNKENVV